MSKRIEYLFSASVTIAHEAARKKGAEDAEADAVGGAIRTTSIH